MTYRGAVLDVDGTVVRGNDPIPGAKEGVQHLDSAGIDRLFVSNNPTKPPEAYVPRLGNAGFEVSPEDVITAGAVATSHLADEHADDDLFVIGAPTLVEQFEDAGLRVVEEPEDADVVVVSIDHRFDYDMLCKALWALSDDDVRFIGTDPDMVIPAPGRDVPGSGAVIHAVAGVTGRDPDLVLGKPSDVARQMILERLAVPPEECLVVGDRLDTDIALGDRCGMTTVLVRTGVTDEQTLRESDITPDHVIDSLADIDTVLDGN